MTHNIGGRSSGRPARVLLVVPTLGRRAEWLRDSVLSIQESASTTPHQVGVRLVAPSSAGLGSLAEKLGVELVESDRPGLSAAINDGWRSPHAADFVGWLGDDDLLAPGSLSESVRVLERCGNAPAVYGHVRSIDELGRTLWMMRPTRLAQSYIYVGKNLIPQPGSLFRWKDIERVAGVDEGLKAAMDQDLFMKLRRLGRLAYVRRELAAFRIHSSSITSTKGSTNGGDESARTRGVHSPRLASVSRPITEITDRLVFGTMRRLPVTPAPLRADGSAYTSPRG